VSPADALVEARVHVAPACVALARSEREELVLAANLAERERFREAAQDEVELGKALAQHVELCVAPRKRFCRLDRLDVRHRRCARQQVE